MPTHIGTQSGMYNKAEGGYTLPFSGYKDSKCGPSMNRPLFPRGNLLNIFFFTGILRNLHVYCCVDSVVEI